MRNGGLKFSARVAVPALVVAVVIGLALTGLAGAQTVLSVLQATLMEPNQKTPEVTTEELRRILAEGSAYVFDARPHKEYAVSHIPGALNVAAKPGVPISVYVSDVREVERLVGGNKATPIVLYCNGPFCGKSKRLGEELVAAGFTNVRRYQLGVPTWRALVGVTEVELEGVLYVYQGDRTAVFLDARSPEEFKTGSIRGVRNLPLAEVKAAKDDGRLPMEDHNTRIIVFGRDSLQARAVAEAIAREAFHNVSYFVGTYDTLRTVLK